MDTGGADLEASASIAEFKADPGAESDKIVFLEGSPPDGELIDDLGIPSTMLTRLELCLATFSEKIVNLSFFMMHLATLESQFEALDLEKDDAIGSAMEFDLLSGILDSEVSELDQFLATLQSEITDAGEELSSWSHLGEDFMAMQERLRDSEQCLKYSEEQFLDIKMQSATFRRTLSSIKREENSGNGEAHGANIRGYDQPFDVNAEIKMQTTEQQRNILRMLEKSLAREMDLEKNVNDLRQIAEELKLRVLSLEQELVHTEEEASGAWERWFEADNAFEILMGTARDLVGKLQISQFNLNGLSQRESELRAQVEASLEQLNSRDGAFDKSEGSTAEVLTNGVKADLSSNDKLNLADDSEALALKEKVSSLEKKLKESEFQLHNAKASANAYQEQYNILCAEARNMENIIVELKENVSKADSQANGEEAMCKLLTETDTALHDELALLKDSVDPSERVGLLERQIKELDVRLQHAVASAEASQEKQNMLYSTIRDMENVIKDLKSKVLKAESRADSAEDKCILLSESNAALNEELSFLRSRLESLEGSLHQVEEAKLATARDIGVRTKIVKGLVAQLAVERERLDKQISSLAIENKILVVRLKQAYKDPFHGTNDFDGDNSFSARETKEEVNETSATSHEVGRTEKNLSTHKDDMKMADAVSDIKTVRRIDAGVLDYKHILIAMLVLLFSAATYLLKQHKF